MLSHLLPIIMPILICTGIGVIWVKLKQPLDTKCLSSLISNVGIPCILLSSLNNPGLTLAVVGRIFVAGGLAILCFIAISVLALKLLRLEARRYLPALCLPNSSNLGLPIAYFAFGKEGIVFAIAFSTLIQVGHATWGIWLASGKMSLTTLLTNPIIYALCIAMLLIQVQVPIPEEILATIKQLGAITVPLMLIMLGTSLAEISFTNIVRSIFLAVVRVGGGFGIGLTIASLMDLPRVAAGTFAIQCAMPVAVLSYLFAKQYNGPSKDIAATIFVSTALTLASLPLILSVVTAGTSL